MRALNKIRLRLRSLLHRDRLEHELEAELHFISSANRRGIASGMAPSAARGAALRTIGGITQLQEECRDMRRITLIENLVQDLRYAVRALRKDPGFTAIAVVTLALGIGATTAVSASSMPFCSDPCHTRILPVWSGIRLSPAQLLAMEISPTGPKYRDSDGLNHYWQFRDLLNKTPVEGGPNVPVPLVSPGYFRTLGIPLLRGRDFDAGDRPGSPPVAIISNTMARRYFPGENPIGQRLKHGGPHQDNPFREIVGVVGDVKYSGLDQPDEAVYYEPAAEGPFSLPCGSSYELVAPRGGVLNRSPLRFAPSIQVSRFPNSRPCLKCCVTRWNCRASVCR